MGGDAFTTQCPSCGRNVTYAASMAGKIKGCPTCKKDVHLPPLPNDFVASAQVSNFEMSIWGIVYYIATMVVIVSILGFVLMVIAGFVAVTEKDTMKHLDLQISRIAGMLSAAGVFYLANRTRNYAADFIETHDLRK